MSDPDPLDNLRLTLSPPGSHSYTPQTASGNPSVSSSSTSSTTHISPETTSRPAELPERSASRRPRRAPATTTDHRAATHKEERIPPPYPWSTDRRAVVQPLEWMLVHGISRIYGEVSCKKCGNNIVDVDLQSSFYQLSTYFLANRDSMHDRAPRHWTNPQLLACHICHQNDHVRPIIDAKKRSINWLFLLLTETLGICTLEQLKYFCKHTRKHRTGAKDRVLYLTYAGLLTQLNPAGRYDS